MLGSDHIFQALEIIRLQFKEIGGLFVSLLFSSDPSRQIDLNLKVKNIYVIHTPNLSYWVVFTNFNHGDQDKWVVLDSLNNINYLKQKRQTIIRILSVQSSCKNRIEINTINVQQQNGVYDCLFALAYVVELCQQKNSTKLQFDQSKMGEHYKVCISNREFKSFDSSICDVPLTYAVQNFNRGKIGNYFFFRFLSYFLKN